MKLFLQHASLVLTISWPDYREQKRTKPKNIRLIFKILRELRMVFSF